MSKRKAGKPRSSEPVEPTARAAMPSSSGEKGRRGAAAEAADLLVTGGALGGALFRDLAAGAASEATSIGASSAATAEPDPLLDQVVDHFRVLERIGSGGMGAVYRAIDLRLSRPVALKFLPFDRVHEPRAVDRVVREARAVSGLNHPCICVLHAVGEHLGSPYLVFELLEGTTLEERLQQGPLALERALEIAAAAAEGLAAAHEAGVLHRDIKPANLFITRRGHLKILDFGIAKLTGGPKAGETGFTGALTLDGDSSLTQPGATPGTLGFMSPEQLRGEELDAGSDLFSLGAVLYQMLTGNRPFAAPTTAAIIDAILRRDPPAAPLQAYPPRLRALVQRLLAKDPARRVAAAGEVHRELEELRRDLVVRSSSDGTGPMVPRAHSTGAASSPLATAVRRDLRPVGRAQELADLRQAWSECVDGAGLVLCLAGEPGMGKTTVVEEFLAEIAAGRTPTTVARGCCSERLAGAEAYLPIFESIDSLLQGPDRELARRVLQEKAPTWYLQTVHPTTSQETVVADTADARIASRERMKRELAAFFLELSLERPLVVFLDDLHWADVSTIDMLSHVGARCRSMALLLIGAYRPSDLLLANHPFVEVRRELQGRGLCREIELGLLRAEDIATYVDREFPGHQFPGTFPSLLHARTEGHPLFMTDLLGDLRARGTIERQGETWVLTRSVPEIQRDLPQSTRGMIERKIARLDDADRRLLGVAAVQGQEFDSATVATATGTSIDAVEERLDALSRLHHLVHLVEDRELPDGTLTQRYRFAHVLYQNAFHGALRRRELVRWSEAVAAALVEAWGEESREIASSLAHLFEGARWHEEACDYFLLAAQHAAELYANHEAVLLARRAMANAEKLEGKARLEGVLAAARQLGQLNLTLSRMTDAIADFEVAERAADELGNVEAQVNAICAAAVARFNLKQMDETKAEGERALAIARAAGSAPAAAAAELVLGVERLCYGAIDEAERHFERSVPLLRETGPPLHALEAIGFAALQQAWQLDYEEADRAVGWTLQRAREVRSPYHVVMNLFVRGMSLFNQGRLGEGLHDLEEGMRLAEQNDERYWLSRFPNTLGWVFTELQDRDTALRLNEEGARLARENEYGKPEANSQLNLAQHCLDVGELDRARGHLERAEQIFAEDVWYRWRYNIRLQAEFARYWLLRGDTVRAGRAAAESLQHAVPRKARKHIAWAHKVLGDVAAAEERWSDARAAYDTAIRVISRHRCPIVEWKILDATARMAAAHGDRALAESCRGRARQVVGSLSDAIGDERLRRGFLRSAAIRAAIS